MTAAVAGVGTLIALRSGSSSPYTWSNVAEVLSIGGPEIAAEEIDVSSLDSTGGYKEYITGMKDGGSVNLEMNWIGSNAQQELLRDRVDGGSSDIYRITWPDSPATVATFTGVVTKFSMNTEPNSAITASVTIRISGPVTWS